MKKNKIKKMKKTKEKMKKMKNKTYSERSTTLHNELSIEKV